MEDQHEGQHIALDPSRVFVSEFAEKLTAAMLCF